MLGRRENLVPAPLRDRCVLSDARLTVQRETPASSATSVAVTMRGGGSVGILSELFRETTLTAKRAGRQIFLHSRAN